jgi:hypothetical protein
MQGSSISRRSQQVNIAFSLILHIFISELFDPFFRLSNLIFPKESGSQHLMTFGDLGLYVRILGKGYFSVQCRDHFQSLAE